MENRNSVFILGLRRSGTTLLFNILRQDKRFVSFDEPFSPAIRDVPNYFAKGTWNSYYRIFEEGPREFWDLISSISWDEELDSGLTPKQVAWLEYLLSRGASVLIDETRLHSKMDALQRLVPNASIIHLHRSASAFTSSHLIPREPSNGFLNCIRSRSAQQYRKIVFWRPNRPFDSWQIESIIGTKPNQCFGQMLEREHIDAERVFSGGAVSKLLAYWLLHFRRIEADGKRLFGSRFLSVKFESFCENPTQLGKIIHKLSGIDVETADFDKVQHARGAHMSDSIKWKEKAALAGFGDQEIARLL